MQESTITNMVWAWLFSKGKTKKVIMVNGEPQTVGLDRQQVDNIVRSFLGPVVDEIVNAYDWDFIFGEDSVTTTASENEYTLRGADDDCGDIINVRYGTGRGKVIEQLNYLETDRREGEDESAGEESDMWGVYGYTLLGRSDDGYPLIQLYDTPLVSNTLQYRYRKKDLSIGSLPDKFAFAVRDMIIAQFDPSYLGVGERSLRKLIDRYKPGGDEYETVRMHPSIEAGNIRRRDNMGGC